MEEGSTENNTAHQNISCSGIMEEHEEVQCRTKYSRVKSHDHKNGDSYDSGIKPTHGQSRFSCGVTAKGIFSNQVLHCDSFQEKNNFQEDIEWKSQPRNRIPMEDNVKVCNSEAPSALQVCNDDHVESLKGYTYESPKDHNQARYRGDDTYRQRSQHYRVQTEFYIGVVDSTLQDLKQLKQEVDARINTINDKLNTAKVHLTQLV